MDHSEKELKNKSQSKRSRKNFEKTSLKPANFQAKKIFEKIKKNKGLTTNDLMRFLKGAKNFLGVFPSDQIPKIRDSPIPLFFIVNIDNSSQPGSHWIGFRLNYFSLEIYDSLGFNPSRWNKFPPDILKFFLRYRLTHKFSAIPKLQAENTFNCGLFCVYFVLARGKKSLDQCLFKFSNNLDNNQSVLYREINLFF